MSILPLPAIPSTSADVLDVRVLDWALRRCPLSWHAPMLDGESLEEARARRAAAADIFDELLREAADKFAGGDR